jgi:hypothetical protein
VVVYVKGFEGLYEVWENGIVVSVLRQTSDTFKGKPRLRWQGGKILAQVRNKRGYMKVMLWKDNKMYTKLVHRIVAEAFLDNPENKLEVNHIDGNPSNNHVTNLEWNTRVENARHSIDVLRRWPRLRCASV